MKYEKPDGFLPGLLVGAMLVGAVLVGAILAGTLLASSPVFGGAPGAVPADPGDAEGAEAWSDVMPEDALEDIRDEMVATRCPCTRTSPGTGTPRTCPRRSP